MDDQDQTEKMEALKKVYAEIILNTAKHAAARVMVSERKAVCLHRDLQNTKEEAVRMLLRFKRMIDVKTTEAETTALSQQKRIKELDEQLNETESVIMDLRAEIRKANERLEVMKNSHMQQSNQENTYVNPAKEITKSDPNLASIIIGHKELELYRKGYTHRIRALETNNMVDKKKISKEKELINAKLAENDENNAFSLRRSVRKRKPRCWDEISSLFKSRDSLSHCKGNNGMKFEETKDDEILKKHETAAKESVGTACLKYTFSRRQKKVCSSLGLTCQNRENEKSTLVDDDSYSDSQNIIDVACQLISLSKC